MAAKVKYTGWGLNALDSSKLVLTWYWNNKYTKEFSVIWEYSIRFNKKTAWQRQTTTVAYRGANNTSEFSIPSDAYEIRAKVTPISKTYKKDKKELKYFTAEGKWTQNYNLGVLKPPKPTITPTVGTIRDFSDAATKYRIVIDDIDGNLLQGPNKVTSIDFYILAFDGSGKKSSEIINQCPIVASTTNANRGRCTLDYVAGHGEIVNFSYRYEDTQGDVGPWADYTGSVNDDSFNGYLFSRPNNPKNLKLQVINYRDDLNPSTASLKLKWDPPYYEDHLLRGYIPHKVEIQYLIRDDSYQYSSLKEMFDLSQQEAVKTTIPWSTFYDISNIVIGGGKKIYCRIRNVEDRGYQDGRNSPDYEHQALSDWAYTSLVVSGKVPGMPTIWSSKENLSIDDNVDLFWIHNSENQEQEEQVTMEFSFDFIQNGSLETITRTITINDSELNANASDNFKRITFSVLNLLRKENPNNISNVTWTQSQAHNFDETIDYTIRWRAKTRNIYGNNDSEYSGYKTIKIYQPPTISLSLENQNQNPTNTVDTYPIVFNISSSPISQMPLTHYFTVKALRSHTYMNPDGSERNVTAGDIVFEKIITNPDSNYTLTLLPGDLYLENGLDYNISCNTSFDSGLEASSEITINLDLGDDDFQVGASVTSIEDKVIAYIYPFIGETQVTSEIQEVIDRLEQMAFDDPERESLMEVLESVPEGDMLAPLNDQSNYLVAVHRKNNDGTFTLIDDYYQAGVGSFSIDLHPNIGNVTYRIVGINQITGKMVFSEVEGTIEENAILINWDESIEDGPMTSDENEMSDPGYSTNLLRLPYDIEISDNHSNDVSLVEYIGRQNPVSYYGTQKSHTSTWNTKIPKDDTETLAIIKKLAVYSGDCYVREPSGDGYWANVKVSYSQKYDDLTIPISLSITKVEGGE